MASKTSTATQLQVGGTPPFPSSKSGKRFDELYRLKGVVSIDAAVVVVTVNSFFCILRDSKPLLITKSLNLKQLGTGAFSTVREGYHRSNREVSYAVKCVNRKKLSEEDEAALLDEVGILKEVRKFIRK
jgi:hypothetical protein